ncbi:hypothetical protein PYW08_010432 [Mythimna loreyi]|uniref:Uncharacterized protein n=1 Tax=Mythimna loreyi TaxID=667449 RepID=A0ACC2Q726_9NEOP|nr:hypothetical protein PYW08_010432 [Mythimna loreyi]
MKELLAVISLLVSGAVAEPPAPYAPSGWRPDGPAFVLPQRGQDQQPSQYLPPPVLDPRNPNVEYGTPQEEDVSVQGLPPQREEVPFFNRSPVNGRQNVGQNFNSDIQNLDQGLKQTQYQEQQQRYREFERQRQRDQFLAANRLPKPQIPAQFAPRTTSTTTTTEAPTTEVSTESTTEQNLNEGETLESSNKDAKVSVEVAKQKLQEFPGELFLSSLAQLQLQPQFIPLQQFGQLRSPLYLQPVQSQKQVAGFDAQTHFAALPSIIAQQQLQQQKVQLQNPALFVAEQPQAQIQPVTTYQQPQFQAEPVAVQPAQAVQPQGFYGQPNAEPVPQYQTVNAFPQQQLQPVPQFPAQTVVLQAQDANQLQGQYQPQQPAPFQPQTVQFQPQPDQYQPQTVQFQPQPQQPDQYQPQTVQFQPQPAQFQPQPAQFQPQPAQFQPQPAQFQPQPAQFQPQQPSQFQPQSDQESQDVETNVNGLQPQLYQQPMLVPNQYQQPAYIQAQLLNYPGQEIQYQQAQLFQGQFQQQNQYQPSQSQSPNALQSGLDVNQQGNDIEEPQDQEEESQDEGRTATAVATAFGARTQPRVQPQYGAPYPVPKVQAAPGAVTTTESPAEEVTDEGPVVAQAVAIADGNRRKNAKLRSRRVRPVFTVDRSGHLVLAQGQ